MEVSGATNPIWLCRDGVIEEIRVQRISVGYQMVPEDFVKQEIQLQEGDRIYTFSDGFADQFGGDKGVPVREVVLEDQRAQSRRHSLGVHLVLEYHWYAVKRSDSSRISKGLV